MRTKILTDTTCDLSKERREALDITALPLHVMLGGVDHLDAGAALRLRAGEQAAPQDRRHQRGGVPGRLCGGL